MTRVFFVFFFSSRRRHTRCSRDWSSDVCSSDLYYSRFYTRRALRILPLYFAILPVLALFHLASWPFLVLSFLYLSNVAPLFGVAAGYGVLWSLAVEE